MSNHTLSAQMVQMPPSGSIDWEAKYNTLQQEYVTLQTEHNLLKDNLVFIVDEARRDRDHYMACYEALLNEKEVAA